MSILASVDPGYSSGGAILEVPPHESARLIEAFQVKNGVEGFVELLEKLKNYQPETWICEKFSPRPSSVTGFSQDLKTTLPLVCEGIMIGSGIMPVYRPVVREWRSPSLQYVAGGNDKVSRRKNLHKFLKDSGFYVTGGMLGAADADDARSAIGHGLAYIARELKHKPTWELISSWEN